MCNDYNSWNAAMQVEQGMKLDGSLLLAKLGPGEKAPGTNRSWWHRARKPLGPTRRRSCRLRRVCGRAGSAPARSRRRCANRAPSLHGPRCCARLGRECRGGRAWFVVRAGKLRCRGGSRDKLVARKPGKETGPNKKAFEFEVALIAPDAPAKCFDRKKVH